MNDLSGRSSETDRTAFPGLWLNPARIATPTIPEDVRLLFLHPRLRGRNALLAGLFLEPAAALRLYYRVPAPVSSFSRWYADFCAQMERLHDLRLPPLGSEPAEANCQDCGAALGQALARYPEPALLFFDDLDLDVAEPEFVAFVRGIVAHLRAGSRLIVSAERLHTLPWLDLLANGTAALLDEHAQALELLSSAAAQGLPYLEVYALGDEAVFVNGRPVQQWHGILTRNLFYFFIDHALVTREQIFHSFWPHLAPREATNIFHVTKRKVNECLEEAAGQPCELMRYAAGFYRESGTMRRFYDALLFEHFVMIGLHHADEAQRLQALLRALHLYRGPFLAQCQMRWADERRSRLHQLWLDALMALGQLYMRRGQFVEALREFRHALQAAPQREDLHRATIQAYEALGDHAAAHEQLRAMRRWLGERQQPASFSEGQGFADATDADAAR